MAEMDLAVFFEHPEEIGHEIGFSDLTELHGTWIKNMVFGSGDYTLPDPEPPTDI